MNFKQMQTKKAEGGFTLIELMIVVAIIGILAAVAIPAYQNYVAKSKFAAALGEVAAGKTGFEVKLNEGATPAAPADAGLAATATANCTFAVTGTTLACTIVGGPSKVNGKVITLTRAEAGTWSCGATVAAADQSAVIGAAGVCTAGGGGTGS